MFALSGVYDGKKVVLTEKVPVKKRFKVIVTFLEELPGEENEIRSLPSQASGLEFWENCAEDLYQDYLVKKTEK